MRVGIDCTYIAPGYVGGLATYVHGLIEALQESVGAELQLRLFTTPENRSSFEKYNSQYIIVETVPETSKTLTKKIARASLVLRSPSIFRRLNDSAYHDVARSMEKNIDILYTPNILNYYSWKVPTVSSPHDIQHVHFPDFFSLKERISRGVRFRLTATYATVIQASSNYIKSDLMEFFKDLSPGKIVVIPEGVNTEAFSKHIPKSVLDKYNIPSDYILYPAQLWKHKNHITLLKAVSDLKNKGVIVPLVLTGAKMSGAGEVFDFITQNNLKDQVYFLGKVPFEDLIALYQNTRALVVPSLHESSSLPILEACVAGAPVIASDIPAITEMAEKLNIFLFERYNSSQLSSVLQDLWAHKLDVVAQVKHNKEKVLLYTWKHAAKLYLQAFGKLV